MGIRFSCPNGHKLNVKTFLAGKRAICPDCGAKVIVPSLSESAALPSLGESVAVATIGVAPPQLAVEATAPSGILALEDFELPPAPQNIAPTAVADEQLPDSIIAATVPTATMTSPTDGHVETVYDPSRERTRRNQMLMAVALLFVVIVLAGVLLWVLKRGASPAPASTEPAPAKTTNISPKSLHILTRAKV